MTPIIQNRESIGPVWDRGLGKRVANKSNAALPSLLAFLAAPVHLAAYRVEHGCATRVRRRPFGGIFLLLPLKRVADAVPNRAIINWILNSQFSILRVI